MKTHDCIRGSRRLSACGPRPDAGFTLIEVLAVIVILAVLAGALLTAYGPLAGAVEIETQRKDLLLVAAACESYENDHGDFPPSTYPTAMHAEGGGMNRGIECLVTHLWSDGREGLGLDADSLVNTDGDRARNALSDLGTRDLLEIVDQWDNPVAYIHNADYGDEFTYLTWDGEQEVENVVRARQNPSTKSYYKRTSFQLISAGSDGIFDTDDDVTNFE